MSMEQLLFFLISLVYSYYLESDKFRIIVLSQHSSIIIIFKMKESYNIFNAMKLT